LTLFTSVCESTPQLVYTPYAFATPGALPGDSASAYPGTQTAVPLHNPAGVAVDTNGNVYVADTFNGALRKLAPSGTTWVMTTIASGFNAPYGVAVDNSNNIYLADTLAGAIRKFTPSNTDNTNWVETTLASGLADPTCVAVDTNGNVYVGELSSVIGKVTPSGGVSVLAGLANNPGTNDGAGNLARFNSPYGVALDRAGNVYVADSGNDTIRKVTPAGVVSTLAGLARVAGFTDGTNNVAQFSTPYGVAVDGATNVFVADSDNNSIRRATRSGTNWVVTTIGGLFDQTGFNDGVGIHARFRNPDGVAADAKGVVYVADTQNSAIRKGTLVVDVPVIIASSVAFSNSHLGFNLTGTQGTQVVVQVSSNLVNWLPVWTNMFGAGPLPFGDPQGVSPKRFYRAVTP